MYNTTYMAREIAGVNIGDLGEPRIEVVETFAQRGVKVTPAYVPQLRNGRGSGDVIVNYRDACASLLRYGSALRKNELYERIATRATSPEIRKPHVCIPKRFSSLGFTASLADSLGIPLTTMNEIFRSMRVEAVITAQEGMDSDLRGSFNSRVYDFLESWDYPHSRSKSPTLQKLNILRDDGTFFAPDNFYRVLYERPNNRFIGAWTTHEVDWFAQFYAPKTQLPSIFSSFDIEVLKETGQARQGFLPEKITEQTGISVNYRVLETHTRALLGRIQIKD